MLRLDGKVAIVTGAGASGPGWGNGKAAATLLARQARPWSARTAARRRSPKRAR